jgi:hypothetical protein
MEQSALGVFMRDSSLWTYPIVNLAHILGVAALFGATLIIDLRLLGFWRRAPLAAVAVVTVPVARTGFVLAAVTGAGLLATKATEYADNPYLLIKFVAIGLGLLNVTFLTRSAAWSATRIRELSGAEHRRLALMGAVSLVCWFTAVAAGRLIAYW